MFSTGSPWTIVKFTPNCILEITLSVYFLDSVQRAGIYFSKEELTKLFHVALSETFKSIGVTACAENVRFIELATEVYTRSK